MNTPQNKAKSFFDALTLEQRLEFQASWNACSTRVTDIAVYSHPAANLRDSKRNQEMKAKKGIRPDYEVAHFVDVARNKFYEAMLEGKTPQGCSDTAMSIFSPSSIILPFSDENRNSK
mgnify:CR=1 FL=1